MLINDYNKTNVKNSFYKGLENMEKKNLAFGLGGIGGAAIGTAVAWKLLSREKTVNWDDYADEIHHHENSDFVEVDGITIHYQEFGDATNPKMVLIHGYS